MKKPKIPSLKEFQDYVLNHGLIKRLIDWSKNHSLPGFFKVPIYDVVIFVYNEIQRFDLFTRANSIAFSFFISVFPSLITLFTILPFLQGFFLKYLATQEDFEILLQEEIFGIMPGNAGQALIDFVLDITTTPRIGLLSFGFILAIYFSSNGMLAMMQGFEKSYKNTFKSRTGLRKRMVAIGLTVLLGVLLIASVIFIILGNVIIGWLGNYIESAGFSVAGLTILRWLAITGLFYFGISVLYRYGAATHRRFSIFSPGATLATTLSLASSLAFSIYIDGFERYESYDKFYGSIAAIIIMMLWIQINSLIILIGFELNASIAINRDLKEAVKDDDL